MAEKHFTTENNLLVVAVCSATQTEFSYTAQYSKGCTCRIVQVRVFRNEIPWRFNRERTWWTGLWLLPPERDLPETIWQGSADRFPFRTDGPLAYLSASVHNLAHEVLLTRLQELKAPIK